MASGIPVVVSNRSAPPEVVGAGGWVVEPNDEGVEQALLEIVEDPVRAQRKGAEGQATRRILHMGSGLRNGWLHVLRRVARNPGDEGLLTKP